MVDHLDDLSTFPNTDHRKKQNGTYLWSFTKSACAYTNIKVVFDEWFTSRCVVCRLFRDITGRVEDDGLAVQ